MLYILDLEPLAERYSIQWRRWFEAELHKRGIGHLFISGDKLTETVETGKVLDAEGTCFWKMRQMANVCEIFKRGWIKTGDKFFTMDLWHPGLECIPYMAQLQGVKIEVYGFLHAGSYITGDFAEPMAPWACNFELGWVTFCSKIFVGSEYHKSQFIKRRFNATPWVMDRRREPFCNDYLDKFVVTGNPLDTEEIRTGIYIPPVASRARWIVFPHRWDDEKDPQRFVRLMNRLWEKRQDFKVRITTSRAQDFSSKQKRQMAEFKCDYLAEYGLTKTAYYQRLAHAKVFVSTAIEETFGYCLAEAVTLGCHPVVEAELSYPELLSGSTGCLYHNDEEAVDLISRALDNSVDWSHLMMKYDGAIGRILAEMECLPSVPESTIVSGAS